MKDLESLDAAFVIDTFLLLLIGIGPKIALVPFLEATRGMPYSTERRVVRKMLTTAAAIAALLLVLGGLLTRLLHFSPGALAVASGIVLLIIAVAMVLGRQDGKGDAHPTGDRDPMRLAVFPLAVPYLLNPVGIVTLVTLSAEAESVAVLAARTTSAGQSTCVNSSGRISRPPAAISFGPGGTPAGSGSRRTKA